MNDKYGIVVLEIRQSADGLYTATSSDLEGVFIAHREFDKIVEDVPEVMRMWFKRNKNMDIEVFLRPPHRTDGTHTISAVPVPAEIAAQALQR